MCLGGGRTTDHQRDLPVGQTHHARHDGTEHHDQTVHGRHGIEEVRVNNLHARLEQLGADHHGHRTANQQHDEGEPQVQGTDVLVVGSRDPAHQAAGCTVIVVIVVCGSCTHCIISPLDILNSFYLAAATSAGCTMSPVSLPKAFRW